jgi:hypothetical protein
MSGLISVGFIVSGLDPATIRHQTCTCYNTRTPCVMDLDERDFISSRKFHKPIVGYYISPEIRQRSIATMFYCTAATTLTRESARERRGPFD